MQLFFIENVILPGTVFELPTSDYKHAVQVLRMQVGEQIHAVGSDGTAYLAKIVAIDEATSSIKAVAEGVALPDTELPLDAEIICGLPKRDKAEWIVQKATELGANRIIFFSAERSIVQWRPQQIDKKLQRLQQIAHDAAAQSHRRRVPQVVYWSQLLTKLPEIGLNLVAYEEVVKAHEDFALVSAFQQLNHAVSDTQNQAEDMTIRMIFGPEGGLTEQEVARLADRQVQAVGLGPRILRTETAPLYFLSSLSYAIELLKGKNG